MIIEYPIILARNIFLALFDILATCDFKVTCDGWALPLWSIAHGQDKLHADKKDAGISQDNEEVFPYMMSKLVKLIICQRTCYEVKRQVEIGLGLVSVGSSPL